MYCRRCSYPLNELAGPPCPECGNSFDPGDPRTYERRPARWRHTVAISAAFALAAITVLSVVGGAFALKGGLFQSYEAAFWPHLLMGVVIASAAASIAAAVRSLPGRLLLIPIGVLSGWLLLFLGVENGFRAWQSLPDPPDEAFADGAQGMAALLAGWIPAALLVSFVFTAVWLVVRDRRHPSRVGRRQESAAG